MATSVSIFTDGAARGNPGPSASGFRVYSANKLLHSASVYNGIKTNNYAEYTAAILALEWCLGNLADPKGAEIELFSDSQLVVRQLTGKYKVRSKDMIALNDKARRLALRFGRVKFSNLPREHKGISEVDAALNALLDSMEK